MPLLAQQFLASCGAQQGQVKRFSPAALDRLSRHRWPGNVHELRNAVQRACVMSAGALIDDECLPDMASAPPATSLAAAHATEPAARDAVSSQRVDESITLPFGTSLAQAERALILATLRACHHHKERTAAALGISLKTLYNRLKEYAAAAFPELACGTGRPVVHRRPARAGRSRNRSVRRRLRRAGAAPARPEAQRTDLA